MKEEIACICKNEYSYIEDSLNQIVDFKLLKGKKIVLKPNVRSVHGPERSKTTNPSVLESVIKYFQKRCNNEIIVTDSAVIGVDSYKAAKKSGVWETCKKLGVQFIDSRDFGYKIVDIDIEPGTIEVSNIVYENIYLVDIPKLKSTYGVPLSLAVKNLKGLISDKSKLDFHTYGIQKLLCRLAKIIVPDLCIIDGTNALSLDTVVDSDVVISSTNFLGIDKYVTKEVGFNIGCLQYLKDCVTDISKVYKFGDFTPLSDIKLENITLQEFANRFGISIVGTPCSSCLGCLYKAISKSVINKDSIIYAGHCKKEDIVETDKKSIIIGNCAIESVKDNLPSNSVMIKGCPPLISDIKEVLKD